MLKEDNTYAFKCIFDKYQQRVFSFSCNYLGKSEAEEIVQSVFVKVWESRKTINEEMKFSSYLFTISKNSILNCLRYNTYINNLSANIRSNNSKRFNSEETGEVVEYQELKSIIEKAINELPERRRTIFLLNREEGLSYSEISNVLDISVNTVDTQIRRSLKYLRERVRIIYNT